MCMDCVAWGNFQRAFLVRLWFWVARRKILPARGHRTGCNQVYFGRCECEWHRPPTLREVMLGQAARR